MKKNDIVKRKLLETAKELLEKDGLKGLTIQNLIERCNIGKTTFYKHFPTKKDLLLQLKRFSTNNNINLSGIKEQIADVAKEAFGRYGFSNIDMDTIARNSNLNRVTLYRYFSSKEELLEYCIHGEFSRIKSLQSRSLENFEDPEEALKHCFSMLIRYIDLSRGNLLISETWNQIYRNEKIRAYARDLSRNFSEMYLKILDAGQKKGVFKKGIDRSVFISSILVIQNGILFSLSFERELHSIDIVADTMINLLLKEISTAKKTKTNPAGI